MCDLCPYQNTIRTVRNVRWRVLKVDKTRGQNCEREVDMSVDNRGRPAVHAGADGGRLRAS